MLSDVTCLKNHCASPATYFMAPFILTQKGKMKIEKVEIIMIQRQKYKIQSHLG